MAVLVGFLAVKCSSNQQKGTENNPAATTTTSTATDKGVGKFTNVQLTHPLDQAMVAKGKSIYAAKCFACHKLTNEKLVGPGGKALQIGEPRSG